jgi:hypothetical protein
MRNLTPEICPFRRRWVRFSSKERRTRSLVLDRVQEIRGISLVFCEMWGTQRSRKGQAC